MCKNEQKLGHVMEKESSGAKAILLKTKSSGAGSGAMFTKRKYSGPGAVSFLRLLRSPANIYRNKKLELHHSPEKNRLLCCTLECYPRAVLSYDMQVRGYFTFSLQNPNHKTSRKKSSNSFLHNSNGPVSAVGCPHVLFCSDHANSYVSINRYKTLFVSRNQISMSSTIACFFSEDHAFLFFCTVSRIIVKMCTSCFYVYFSE